MSINGGHPTQNVQHFGGTQASKLEQTWISIANNFLGDHIVSEIKMERFSAVLSPS